MSDGIWVNEGEQPVVEGETVTFTITVPYTTVSSGTHLAYKNGTDVSSSCTSGSATVAANVITCKPFTPQAGWGGASVVHEITFVGDGQTLIAKIRCPIIKHGQE